MKNKAYIFIIAGILMFGSYIPSAKACSVVAGYDFPTVEDTLDDGANVFIGKILSTGPVVVGEVIEVEEGDAEDFVVMRSDMTSCANRFQFDKDEYFVVVAPEDDSFVINHNDLDKQFSYFYGTFAQAQDAVERIMDGKDPAPAPTPTPTPALTYKPAGYTLKPGMRGDDVRALQNALNHVLPTILIYPPVYPAKPDGVYGSQTTEAVKNFQRQTGTLAIDGIAGIKTQEALAKEISKIQVMTAQ